MSTIRKGYAAPLPRRTDPTRTPDARAYSIALRARRAERVESSRPLDLEALAAELHAAGVAR